MGEGFWAVDHRGLRAVLHRHELSGEDLRVFLALADLTLGYGKAEDEVSLSQIADMTGYSIQRVCRALARLRAAGLMESRSTGARRTALRRAVWPTPSPVRPRGRGEQRPAPSPEDESLPTSAAAPIPPACPAPDASAASATGQPPDGKAADDAARDATPRATPAAGTFSTLNDALNLALKGAPGVERHQYTNSPTPQEERVCAAPPVESAPGKEQDNGLSLESLVGLYRKTAYDSGPPVHILGAIEGLLGSGMGAEYVRDAITAWARPGCAPWEFARQTLSRHRSGARPFSMAANRALYASWLRDYAAGSLTHLVGRKNRKRYPIVDQRCGVFFLAMDGVRRTILPEVADAFEAEIEASKT